MSGKDKGFTFVDPVSTGPNVKQENLRDNALFGGTGHLLSDNFCKYLFEFKG